MKARVMGNRDDIASEFRVVAGDVTKEVSDKVRQCHRDWKARWPVEMDPSTTPEFEGGDRSDRVGDDLTIGCRLPEANLQGDDAL